MIKRIAHPGLPWLSLALPLALLASACIPEGVRVPQSQFSGMLERKSGLIAYLDIDGNIYTIDQGGNNKTPVTTDAFSDGTNYLFYDRPIWSPNSQSLAFAGFEGAADAAPTSYSLFTAGKDGSALVETHKSPNFLVFYYWSPNSDQLGFISETPNQSLALRTVPIQGGEAARLVDAGAPYYWAWSPDGSSLMAHAGGSLSSQAHLSLLQLEPEVVEYGIDLKPAPFKAPAFSPDGSKVLVAGQTEAGASALVLMDVLGQNQEVLTEYNGQIAFAWSPNGQRVAYMVSPDSEIGTPGALTILDPTGRKQPVELKDQAVYAFFWSPDSKSLAYFIDAPLPVEEGAEPPAADQPNFIWGLHVLDAASGRTHSVQSTMLATERFRQVIPYFDQYNHTLTIWSPDSQNIVLSGYRSDGTPTITVVAASGKLEPRYIADGWTAFWSPK